MRKHTKKWLALLLAMVTAWSLFGCSATQQQETADSTEQTQTTEETSEQETSSSESQDEQTAQAQYSRTPEEIAQQFAQQWVERWSQLQSELTMTNGQGRAFLADLDNDGLGELIFLYDNYIDYDALVYRISGEQAEELGQFTVSNSSNGELSFSLYQSAQPVLYYQTVQTHASQEGSSETEENFISLQDGAIVRNTLYFTSYGDTNTYYDSVEAGANEISQEDYDLLRIGLFGSEEVSQEIVLSAEDTVDCSDEQAVADYVQALFA